MYCAFLRREMLDFLGGGNRRDVWGGGFMEGFHGGLVEGKVL